MSAKLKEVEKYRKLRAKMVSDQLLARGISERAVISAFEKVPRHLFVPDEHLESAYNDAPIPIGVEQTISQPYVVALMLQKLKLTRTESILEIGTGSGYQTALLCELAGSVYSLDISLELIRTAENLVRELGYDNVTFRAGDGFAGFPEAAPFDAIIVSACPDHIPRELVRELKVGGRMILPLGIDEQSLVLIEKTKDGIKSEEFGSVRFVPMKAE